jgi:hypothetical protein
VSCTAVKDLVGLHGGFDGFDNQVREVGDFDEIKRERERVSVYDIKEGKEESIPTQVHSER